VFYVLNKESELFTELKENIKIIKKLFF